MTKSPENHVYENAENNNSSNVVSSKNVRYTSLGSKISDTSTSSEENLTDESCSRSNISPTPTNNSSINLLEPGMQASYRYTKKPFGK